MCVKERMWASVPACASVEKACPRLIAASYLVVTGVIKDDELTVALSLSHSLSLLARKDSLQSPIMGCFWKGQEDDSKGEIQQVGGGAVVFLLLRGQHWSKNSPKSSGVRGIQVHRL